MEKYSEKQFIAGNNIPLDNIEEFKIWISSNIVDEEVINSLDVYTILHYNSDKIFTEIEIWMWDENDTTDEEIVSLKENGILGKLKYEYYEFNEFYHLEEDLNGIHYLGGEIPKNLKIPLNKCPNSFQYIGFISREDLVFSWLTFDLHIIFPLYLGFEKLILEYENPLEPKILNIDEVNSAYSIVRAKKHFNLKN